MADRLAAAESGPGSQRAPLSAESLICPPASTYSYGTEPLV